MIPNQLGKANLQPLEKQCYNKIIDIFDEIHIVRSK